MRNRTLLISSGIIGTIATGLIAYFLFGVYGSPFALSSAQAREQKSFAHAPSGPKAYEQSVTKALKIRSEWRKWANDHDSLLQAIREGARTPETFNRLIDALPAMQTDKASGIQASTFKEGDVPFTWQPFINAKLPLENEEQKRRWEKSKQWSLELFRSQFMENGDVQISQSMNIGDWNIILWASGRVTEQGSKTVRVNGETQSAWVTVKDISPPFAGLKR